MLHKGLWRRWRLLFKFCALQPKKDHRMLGAEARESQSFNFSSFTWVKLQEAKQWIYQYVSWLIFHSVYLQMRTCSKTHKCTDPVGMLCYLRCANAHRHECKLPTFMVLERFKSFLLAFFSFVNERNEGGKWCKAAVGSFMKWLNHYIRC